MADFFQAPPQLGNTYLNHRWLKNYLRFKMPKEMFAQVHQELEKFGARCAGEFTLLAKTAEREKPELVQYDPWGRRIDEIRLSPAWTELQNISAREELVALAYQRKNGEYSRLHQFAKLLLFHPSSAFFTCPLAMADGAARVLEVYGQTEFHRETFRHLTSSDPAQFWTSGQWMTERTGGSDVGQTSTEVKLEGEQIRLYGTKWFSSATTSAVALALARYPGSAAGSRGLSLFLVPTYTAPGVLNHIRVLRLKDKLGTRALPTAELSLEGALTYPLGERDQGVKTVVTMLNITRLYNSICSVGQATRALEMLNDYSGKRVVFGRPIDEQILHTSTFVDEELKSLAGFLLTMEMVHILGKEECAKASREESDILRLLTPVCKLFTAKSAIQTASEVVEGFGGAGYIEDTGVAVHLRDAQVFPIWEGATNVLSLDMLRVMQKTKAVEALFVDIHSRLQRAAVAGDSEGAVNVTRQAVDQLEVSLQQWQGSLALAQEASGRGLAFHLARLYALVLLLDWSAQSAKDEQKVFAPWIRRYLNGFLGIWSPSSIEDCDRVKEMWTGRLNL